MESPGRACRLCTHGTCGAGVGGAGEQQLSHGQPSPGVSIIHYETVWGLRPHHPGSHIAVTHSGRPSRRRYGKADTPGHHNTLLSPMAGPPDGRPPAAIWYTRLFLLIIRPSCPSALPRPLPAIPLPGLCPARRPCHLVVEPWLLYKLLQRRQFGVRPCQFGVRPWLLDNVRPWQIVRPSFFGRRR